MSTRIDSASPTPTHLSPALAPAENSLERLVAIETRRRLESGSIHVYEEVLQRVEAAIIITAMSESNNNLTHAAQRLGISRPTLRSKLRSHLPGE